MTKLRTLLDELKRGPRTLVQLHHTIIEAGWRNQTVRGVASLIQNLKKFRAARLRYDRHTGQYTLLDAGLPPYVKQDDQSYWVRNQSHRWVGPFDSLDEAVAKLEELKNASPSSYAY